MVSKQYNKVTVFIRSLVFYLVFISATIIHGTLSLLVCPFLPSKARFYFVTCFDRFVVWWFKVACRVKYEITGKEHLSKSVPSIILCNHQSSWESFFLQTLIHPQCSVVKKELLKIPFFGWALNLLKPIAIDRRQKLGALKQLIQQGKERLSQGFSVLIFPEGTRVPVGASQPFSRGGAALATATQSPILAIAHNAGELWPAKSFLKYPGTIKLAISPIITTQGKKTIEVYKETTGWITQKIKQLASKN